MKIPNWLKIFFDKAYRFVSAVIKSVFSSAFKMLMARLSNVATTSITKLAATDLSNDQKREQAFQEIKDEALKQALSFNDRDIYLIIDTFYKNLKDEGIIK